MGDKVEKVVLLVEDNDDIRDIYSTVLQHVGYKVIPARNGEEANQILAQLRPDLVLLDISIPKIDWSVGEQIKRTPATRAIPLVALTAHAYAADRERAREIGFDDYVPKPVEPREVAAVVQRLIGPPDSGTLGVPLGPIIT